VRIAITDVPLRRFTAALLAQNTIRTVAKAPFALCAQMDGRFTTYVFNRTFTDGDGQATSRLVGFMAVF
jgi:hypothetical protein